MSLISEISNNIKKSVAPLSAFRSSNRYKVAGFPKGDEEQLKYSSPNPRSSKRDADTAGLCGTRPLRVAN